MDEINITKTKKCNHCKDEKILDQFYKDKNAKDGYESKCKKCRKQYLEIGPKNKRIQLIPEDINNKICCKCKIENKKLNFPKNKGNKDGYANQCKQCYKQYSIENFENQAKYKKQYKNREDFKQREKEYAKKPKAILNKKIYIKKWKKQNPNYHSNYQKERSNKDINFKLQKYIRTRFYHAIKNNSKFSSVIVLLGCSIEDFKQHLEKQFKPEMTWLNHGEIWEIDHIEGCCKFDLSKEEEQEKCFHFSNCQPLFKTTEIAQSFGYLNEIGNRDKEK